MTAHDYKTAFITGASMGIGAALARHLARAGVHVTLAARSRQRLDEVARTISEEGGAAEVVSLDVSDPEHVIEVMEATDDRLGGIDLVVAGAGVGHARWSGKLTWQDCSPTIDVNLRGAVATLVALLPRMVDRGRGHLVGISSLAQYRGLPRLAAYCATKAFVSTFLESLRVDLRRAGIAVTDIRPGYVRTQMTRKNRPMPFLIEPEQAADEIWDAILAKKPVHAFPFALVKAMQTVSGIPDAVYDRLAPRLLK